MAETLRQPPAPARPPAACLWPALTITPGLQNQQILCLKRLTARSHQTSRVPRALAVACRVSTPFRGWALPINGRVTTVWLDLEDDAEDGAPATQPEPGGRRGRGDQPPSQQLQPGVRGVVGGGDRPHSDAGLTAPRGHCLVASGPIFGNRLAVFALGRFSARWHVSREGDGRTW